MKATPDPLVLPMLPNTMACTVHSGAHRIVDLVDLAVLDCAIVIPAPEDGDDGGLELLLASLRELVAGVGLEHVAVQRAQHLQVLNCQVSIDGHGSLLFN